MANVWWPIISIFAIAGPIIVGCGSAPWVPRAEVRQVSAPTGTPRVGLSVGTAEQMLRDTASGETKGVARELGKELARRLGIPFEAVILEGNAQVMFLRP